MKKTAIGIRVHSGWGALVAVFGDPGAAEVVRRKRVAIIDPKAAGAAQPYHFAEKMEFRNAEKHIAMCAATSASLALAALTQIVQELQSLECKVVGSAILLSSGRPLPTLDRILASHALIHTAEGEFFRKIFREALEHLQIPVTGIPERQLDEHLHAAFGKAAPGLQQRIGAMGRSLGPPWTTDQKTAALAAAIVLKKHH